MRSKSIIFLTTLFVFFAINFSNNSHAQKTGTLSGKIIDKITLLPVPEASIELLTTGKGDVADAMGAYFISGIPEGDYEIRVSRIGYKSESLENIRFAAGESVERIFFIEPITLQLRGVEIEADRMWEKYLTEASLVGVEHIQARGVINIPGSLDDPLRAVQISSGVSGGGDYSGFITVRGGSPDQNRVIVDGVVVPNPYRFRLAFGGGMSTINPGTTEDIYLHLGGFSAEYGNSMTSILEVETRRGDRKQMRAEGTLNFTDVSGIIEGPFPLNIGTFLFSVRRTYYDLVVNQISNSNSVFPFFLEFSSRLDFDITKKHRLILRASQNREGTELINEFSEDLNLTEEANSRMGSLTWKSLFNDKWQMNAMLSYYSDDMSYRAFAMDSSSIVQEYESINAIVKHMTYKHNIRYRPTEDSWINAGIAITLKPSRIKFNSADLGFIYARIESPKDIDFNKKYFYYAGYIESSTKASSHLHLRLGARYDYSTLIDKGEFSPRFNLWFKLDDKTTIDASWGVFYQFPNPMTVYTRNVPVDLGANLDIISAEKATHFVVGIERTLDDDFTAKLQLYHKDIDRLLLPEDEINYFPVNSGRGVSRGFEIIFEKKPTPTTRLNGILTYSLGQAQYRTIGQKEWLPFKYDRRHALTGLLNLKLFTNWNISFLGQYSSGLPFTNVFGAHTTMNFDGSTRWDFARSGRFQSRLPAYKKLDARLSYNRHSGRKSFSFYLDVINLTNTQNLYEMTWEKKFLPDGSVRATKRKIFMLPMIPSLGFSFRF